MRAPAEGVHPNYFGPTSVHLEVWLHRLGPRTRHQMRHLGDLHCFFAKQVLSQLSYTPTEEVPFILKHLPRFPNPFLRIFIEWSEPQS